MKGIYLLLGSNLGDRHQVLASARSAIEKNCGPVIQSSSVYESAPWGESNQPAFLNQVIEIESNHSPEDLLAILLQIEIQMGRKRYKKWGERLIDIDILYFNQEIINSTTLNVPHPEIKNRKFTLTPLAEIAPEFTDPVTALTATQMLEQTNDELWVNRQSSSAILD